MKHSTNPATVQKIPKDIFQFFSGNWYGEPQLKTSGDFEEMVQVQPVKFEGRLYAFGLHISMYSTEFIVFNTAHPFDTPKKNTVLWRVLGGEMVGTHPDQRFYNRLVRPATSKKVLYKPGDFHVLSTVFQAIDMVIRKFHVDDMEKYLPIGSIQTFDPIRRPVTEEQIKLGSPQPLR